MSRGLGGVSGGVLGGISGLLGAWGLRDLGERGIANAVKDKLALGQTPDAAKIGRPDLLSPVSGIHQQGRMDTAENILKGTKEFGTNGGKTFLDVLQQGPTFATSATSPLSWINSLINNSEARGRADRLGLK